MSSSLLARLKALEPSAWEQLVELFGPEVFAWCRMAGLQASDAADVGQEVFRAVAAGIRGFRRDRPNDSFRGWLWSITRNKLRDYWRQRARRPEAPGGSDALERLAAVADPVVESHHLAADPPEASRELMHRALNLVRSAFEPRTWDAFWKTTVEEQPVGDVAAELAMSIGAVYTAKSRVLRRLREELGELLD